MALFTAFEFLAACRNRSLAHHLPSYARTQLRAAEDSFNVIGLTRTASVLGKARSELTGPLATPDVAKALEVSLCEIDEPVDLVLARFASEGV
jgi:hypothetical protein